MDGLRRIPVAERWSWIALGAIVVVAFAWRALGALAIVYPSVDGVNYMTIARTLVRDGSLMFSTFPPGWPLIIVPPLTFVGAEDPMLLLRTAQWANVLLGTVAVVLVYLVARRPLGRIGALLLAAFVAFLPDLVITATTDLSEASYLAVLLAGWWALRSRSDWATGLLFGFAYLIRPEALIVLLGVVALRSARDRRPHWKPLVGAAVFVVPFWSRRSRTGVWVNCSPVGSRTRASSWASCRRSWVGRWWCWRCGARCAGAGRSCWPCCRCSSSRCSRSAWIRASGCLWCPSWRGSRWRGDAISSEGSVQRDPALWPRRPWSWWRRRERRSPRVPTSSAWD
jgi:hypothetical protein